MVRIMSKSPLITVEHEEFAQAYIRLGGATAAYRHVYDPQHARPNTTAWEHGCRLAARSDISNRIGFLRAESLAASQFQVVEMIHDLMDIIRADPNELTRQLVVNCRHCHGDDYAYQWDGAEYALACEAVDRANVALVAKNIPPRDMPACPGGFGWNPHGDINPMCPNCMGAGVQHTILSDTTKLSPQARKLFKGVKMTKTGPEILMHDQHAARDMLNRLAGAYKDSLAIPVLPDAGVKPGTDVHKTYLTMIAGGRK